MANIVRPCWISKLEPFNGTWRLVEREKPHGQFDAVVIAHNGNYITSISLLGVLGESSY